MKGAAKSLQTSTRSASRFAQRLERLRSDGRAPTAGLLFVSGSLTRELEGLAESSARALPGTTMMLVAGAGTLSDEQELERTSSVSAVFWRQGKVLPIAGVGKTPHEAFRSLATQITENGKVHARTSGIVFARPDGITPGALEPLGSCPISKRLFGGGTVGGCEPVLVGADGRITRSPAAALLLLTSPPLLHNSPACRLLCSAMEITKVRGNMVLELEGVPALDVLSRIGNNLPDSPLVFAVLPKKLHDQSTGLLIRAVQGVDPMRGGLIVSEEVAVGGQLAFGVRDPVAARSDLERNLREMELELAGAAPLFGVYVNCAGRGAGLYGHQDVDVRMIRSRFEGIPFAGLHSSFEIVPMGNTPALQLYSGVIALYTAPS